MMTPPKSAVDIGRPRAYIYIVPPGCGVTADIRKENDYDRSGNQGGGSAHDP